MTSEVPHIRELEERDLPEMTRLKFVQGDTAGQWQKRFDWQFTNNPARPSGKPLGWVIETTEGRLEGHQMAVPQRVKILNSEQYVAFSADTYVSPVLRGHGFGSRLFETYFNAQAGSLALTSTANQASEYLWLTRFGAFPIDDLNRSFIFIYRSGPLIEEVLARRGLKLFFKSASAKLGIVYDRFWLRPLPAIASSVSCDNVEPDDSSLDEIWKRYRNDYQILTVRDRVYRKWRYNAILCPKPSLWRVSDVKRDLSAWFSLRVIARGVTRVSVCELMDVFGPSREGEFQRSVLACATLKGQEAGADVMEVKGLHSSWRSCLLSLGFRNRLLPSNPFLCRNMGLMNEEILKKQATWHISCADGDAAV